MHILLSPAKTMDFQTPAPINTHTQPSWLHDSEKLIELLRAYTPSQLSDLMGLSDALAVLNVGRYQAWQSSFTLDNAKQAIFAFMGDVYEGLDAYTLPSDSLVYAQNHLSILSGLYGLLRPLDLMQPYRLEMGTKLANPYGRHLYDFWGNRLTDALSACLSPETMVLNLASDEYFKVIQVKRLSQPVVSPVFQDEKQGQFKVISFYAKRARGLMARFVLSNQLTNCSQLEAFDTEGYRYCADLSTPFKPVFRRATVDLPTKERSL